MIHFQIIMPEDTEDIRSLKLRSSGQSSLLKSLANLETNSESELNKDLLSLAKYIKLYYK